MINGVGSLISSRQDMKTLLRFMTVGVVSTLLDFGIFTLLHLVFGFAALPANVISYSTGILNGFVFNRQWTYADRPRKSARLQFVQFTAVSLSALAINTGVVLLLSPQFSAMINNASIGALAAKVCATGIGMCWNFIVNSLWTFRKNEPSETIAQ